MEYLGFIPDLAYNRNKRDVRSRKMDLYHRCLIEILKRWSIYKDPPDESQDRESGQVCSAILKVAFVMGDQKSNDNILLSQGNDIQDRQNT
jgi:hypothetical protein